MKFYHSLWLFWIPLIFVVLVVMACLFSSHPYIVREDMAGGAGCGRPDSTTEALSKPGNMSPELQKLMWDVSQYGKQEAKLLEYDASERIAIVVTPGWLPERKPYQYDGTNWSALWSPYSSEAVEKHRRIYKTRQLLDGSSLPDQ